MQQTNAIPLHHQQFMLAVRREIGWPAFKPANDAIVFCSGRTMDFEVGSEIARIAQTLRKDGIYTGWSNTSAPLPTSFAVIYRELLTVDIIDRVVPYAANDDAPIVFVSTRKDEIFAVDQRGSLLRIAGKPKNIGTGRKRAMKRIRSTAATMGSDLLESNRFVPPGAKWIEPEAAVEAIVRFN